MLEPIRTARVMGILVLLQGMVFLFLWKILGSVVEVGLERYSSLSGKVAKSFFSQDQTLVQLLQTSTSCLPILLMLGIAISICGILMFAFPKQATQILIALRILKWS